MRNVINKYFKKTLDAMRYSYFSSEYEKEASDIDYNSAPVGIGITIDAKSMNLFQKNLQWPIMRMTTAHL